MANEVVFATQDVTLHRSFGEVEDSRGRKAYSVSAFVLPAGESASLEDLAPYQQDAIRDGKVAGVSVMSEDEANKLKQQAADSAVQDQRMVYMPASTVQSVANEQNEEVGPDTSFSDHRLSDKERVANHAERGLEESGESGDDAEDAAQAAVDDLPDDGRRTRELESEEEESSDEGGNKKSNKSKSK